MAKNIKAVYDTCKLLVNKILDQQKDENQTLDESLVSDLKSAFMEIVEFEKMHLIMAHDKYYGAVLLQLECELDVNQDGPTDLRFESGRTYLVLNPIIICSRYKYAEFTGLVIGEILRLSFDHAATYAEINSEGDPKKHAFLEMGSSASISDMIKNDIRIGVDQRGNNNVLRLPNDAYTPANVNKDCGVSPKEQQSIEYYYSVLNKFYKGDKDSSGTPNIKPGGFNADSSAPLGSGKNQPNTKSGGQPTQVHNWEKKDADTIREQTKSIVSDAFNSLSERDRGNMPGQLISQIKKLLAPPQISWKQILRKMIGGVPKPYRKTKTRLNRRQPERADLSGRLPKRCVHVLCAIDTSGSMSDRDIEYCLNEVFNIVKTEQGSKVTIIECDMNINNIYQAKKVNEVRCKVGGRGGTSFLPVVEFVNGTIEDKKWKNHSLCGKFRDAIMIYFTDGYGDYEIPKPKTRRNLWVVLNGEKNLSLKEPYGDVKSLSTDKDYLRMRNSI